MKISLQGNRQNNRPAERGNVLIYILIAIVLFAALSYSVSQMMRGGSATGIGEETSKLHATEVFNYGRIIRQAVQSLKISNGCQDSEISFETEALPGYVNGTNTSCQIFHRDGGDVNYFRTNQRISVSDWVFTGANNVAGVGTTEPDLVAILPNITLTACNAINAETGIPSVGADSEIAFTPYTGTFEATQTLDDANGKMSGCLNYVNSGNSYFFYQVLVQR